MYDADKIIEQTKKWIRDVVIGCNFCPFAAAVIKKNKVYYRVADAGDQTVPLQVLNEELKRLDENENIETGFIIFPVSFENFDDYLNLVDKSELFLNKNGYEGVYQLASFHPDYCFANSDENDAANYTNRSPYPMLHLLREASIDIALKHYSDPESIPERNVNFARTKGLAYMKMLRDTCF